MVHLSIIFLIWSTKTAPHFTFLEFNRSSRIISGVSNSGNLFLSWVKDESKQITIINIMWYFNLSDMVTCQVNLLSPILVLQNQFLSFFSNELPRLSSVNTIPLYGSDSHLLVNLFKWHGIKYLLSWCVKQIIWLLAK